MSTSLTLPGDYVAWLADLKFVQRAAAQFRRVGSGTVSA